MVFKMPDREVFIAGVDLKKIPGTFFPGDWDGFFGDIGYNKLYVAGTGNVGIKSFFLRKIQQTERQRQRRSVLIPYQILYFVFSFDLHIS